MRSLCPSLLFTVAAFSMASGRDPATVTAGPAEQTITLPRTASATQVVAEMDRIRSGYGPPLRGGHLDDAGRRGADEYYNWMAWAGTRYPSNLAVAGALMRTYGVMGDYYRTGAPGYAWRGYVGANRWARRRWLYDVRTLDAQRDMDRYGEAWAALAYANGSWFWHPDASQDPGAGTMPGVRETALEPVALPRVDGSTLNPADREAWDDVRTQFAAISSRVHHARVSLEGLAGRLQARGMSVNPKTGAIALSMQGFMVDAADLIEQHDFARAKEALTRADYERNRLRGVVGQ
jgi:hypothetical protein